MKDHRAFENFLKDWQLRPVGKYVHPDGDILIAEGLQHNLPDEYPDGYYETVWAVQRGEVEVARPVVFDRWHDMQYSDEARKDLRAKAAIADAKKFIEQSKEVGRYD